MQISYGHIERCCLALIHGPRQNSESRRGAAGAGRLRIRAGRSRRRGRRNARRAGTRARAVATAGGSPGGGASCPELSPDTSWAIPARSATSAAAIRIGERHGLTRRTALARRRLAVDLADRGAIGPALRELDTARMSLDPHEQARSEVFRIGVLWLRRRLHRVARRHGARAEDAAPQPRSFLGGSTTPKPRRIARGAGRPQRGRAGSRPGPRPVRRASARRPPPSRWRVNWPASRTRAVTSPAAWRDSTRSTLMSSRPEPAPCTRSCARATLATAHLWTEALRSARSRAGNLQTIRARRPRGPAGSDPADPPGRRPGSGTCARPARTAIVRGATP